MRKTLFYQGPPPVVPKRLRVRPARPGDVAALAALVRLYAEQGILLPRTEENLRKSIEIFRVISAKGYLLACGVLERYTPTVAELRSLAVVPGLRGGGLGRKLVQALLDEARDRDMEMVFALTYQVEFFARLGFSPINRELIPWKAWKDCLQCPKRECCDEVAMACWLRPGAPASPPALPLLPFWSPQRTPFS